MKRLALTKRRILFVTLFFAGMFILYLLLLCFPDPFFAYELKHGPIVIRSDLPIPAMAESVLREERGVLRLHRQRRGLFVRRRAAQAAAGNSELDPARSGLYLRYHLLVAFLLDRKGVSHRDLLEKDFDSTAIERELLAGQAPLP